LVGLFVRLTSEELSGAIIDALSSFIQASLLSGEGDVTYLAGQYVQLAVVLQLLLGIPLLLVWALTMEPVVFWLVQSSSIAFIAEDYARAVAINYLIQAVARTFTVVFHICGHEHFESVIDFSTSTMQLIVVACVVSLVDNANLTTVGYIQVLIGIAGAVAKVTFPVMRGWMKPFRKGMFENFALVQVSISRPLPLSEENFKLTYASESNQNRSAFRHLARATFPLFVGTVLEYGEVGWVTYVFFSAAPIKCTTGHSPHLSCC
jgi:hypothetical protein